MRVSETALGASLAALLAASPALADVTPAEVWDNLNGYLTDFGYDVSATTSQDGDTLTVSDATVTIPIADPGGSSVIRLGDIVLTDQGDGSVRVGFAEVVPIEVTVAPQDDEPVELALDYRQDGLEILVSGTPEEMTYEASGNSISAELTSLVVDGEELPRSAVRAEFSAGPVQATSIVRNDGTARHITQTTQLGDLTYDIAGSDPEGSGSGNLTGRMTGLSGESTSTIPTGLDMSDARAVMTSGLEGSSTFRHEGGQMDFAVTEDGETTTGSATSGGMTMDVSFSGGAFSYDAAARDVTWNMSGGELPFPVTASMDELGMKLAAPLAKSEEPKDVALGVTLSGFTTADMIWNLFDPGKVLPRDPATVAIDLTGKVTPFINLYDEADMARVEAGETMPGELNQLSLNSLTVEAAGAKITGEGDFTFDNTDLQSFDGMPRPLGEANFTVAGANGLIDKLIEMGLVTDEDAMGARMMMSMFGVPGEAPDTLSSKIEVNEQGHVLANGQRIK